ncbi:uncharacterized protein [Argopecten irradians]|uniref:uncharacterized protein n=1 Tax=Argopecten irradians TaxID=31199 RepID=UPI003721DED6
MDLGSALFQKLEEKGLDAQDVDDGEDDFYKIMSVVLFEDAKQYSRCRERICDFQREPENMHYFQLFLPRPNSDTNTKTMEQAFLDDLGKSRLSGTSPTAREIYAACELIGRPIEALVCDFGDAESDPPRLEWRLFIPVLSRVTSQITRNFSLLIVINKTKIIFHSFKTKPEERERSPTNDFANQNTGTVYRRDSDTISLQSLEGSQSPPSTIPRRCFGRKFANELFMSPIPVEDGIRCDASVWKPGTDDNTFYRCLSREMYGVPDQWKRVKYLICALEEEEDSVNVFATFITDKDSGQENAIKDHISKVKSEGSKPTKAEIYAAASLLHAYVYIQSFINGANTWEIYPPIRNMLQNVEPMDSFVALRCENLTETYSIDRTFDTGGHNLREKAPRAAGNLSTIREQIACISRNMLARNEPCCEEHKHFSHYDDSDWERPATTRKNPFSDPPWNTRQILKLLRSEGRELEKIETYGSSLFRCISKEIFGTEEEYERVKSKISDTLGSSNQEDGFPSLLSMSEEEQGRIIQALANWLRVSIYVFTKTGGTSNVRYQWRSYHPTRSEQAIDSIHTLGCRYYITLFYDVRGRKFDRVIPISGCNCQIMSPTPLFAETYGDIQHPGIVNIAKGDRHTTMKRRLPLQFKDEEFICEVRRPLIARQFSESYSVLHERQDMASRFIDSVFQDSNAFYRCLSKELFGTQDKYELIRKCLLDVIEETRPELEYDLKVLASSLGTSVMTVDDLKQRVLDMQNVEREEIYLASVAFATSIFVLGQDGAQNINNFTWKHFSWVAMKKTAEKLNCDSRSEATCPSGGRYYVSLFQNLAGHYDRVVPKYELCNCALGLPDIVERGSLDLGQIRVEMSNMSIEARSVLVTRNVDKCLTKLRISLNTWLQVSEETELLCHQIVAELENRRHGVNIATIVGGSTGLVGAGLAVAGVIAAPFTGGLSLGLTIAGAAVGGVGGATMAGSKITEVVLGSRATDVLKVKQTLLKTKSENLQSIIAEFTESVRTMEIDLKELLRDDNLQAVDSAIFSTISTLVRALHHLYIIPMTVLRVSFQGVAVISAILIPLAVLVDVGSIAHAGWNLSKKSRTSVSEDLRRIAVLLRSCRLQLDTWAYGNEDRDDR